MPLSGHCSSCPDVKFYPTEKTAGEIQKRAEMKAAFDRHFIQKHLRDDASQAAARIVREATQD